MLELNQALSFTFEEKTFFPSDIANALGHLFKDKPTISVLNLELYLTTNNGIEEISIDLDHQLKDNAIDYIIIPLELTKGHAGVLLIDKKEKKVFVYDPEDHKNTKLQKHTWAVVLLNAFELCPLKTSLPEQQDDWSCSIFAFEAMAKYFSDENPEKKFNPIDTVEKIYRHAQLMIYVEPICTDIKNALKSDVYTEHEKSLLWQFLKIAEKSNVNENEKSIKTRVTQIIKNIKELKLKKVNVISYILNAYTVEKYFDELKFNDGGIRERDFKYSLYNLIDDDEMDLTAKELFEETEKSYGKTNISFIETLQDSYCDSKLTKEICIACIETWIIEKKQHQIKITSEQKDYKEIQIDYLINSKKFPIKEEVIEKCKNKMQEIIKLEKNFWEKLIELSNDPESFTTVVFTLCAYVNVQSQENNIFDIEDFVKFAGSKTLVDCYFDCFDFSNIIPCQLSWLIRLSVTKNFIDEENNLVSTERFIELLFTKIGESKLKELIVHYPFDMLNAFQNNGIEKYLKNKIDTLTITEEDSLLFAKGLFRNLNPEERNVEDIFERFFDIYQRIIPENKEIRWRFVHAFLSNLSSEKLSAYEFYFASKIVVGLSSTLKPEKRLKLLFSKIKKSTLKKLIIDEYTDMGGIIKDFPEKFKKNLPKIINFDFQDFKDLCNTLSHNTDLYYIRCFVSYFADGFFSIEMLSKIDDKNILFALLNSDNNTLKKNISIVIKNKFTFKDVGSCLTNIRFIREDEISNFEEFLLEIYKNNPAESLGFIIFNSDKNIRYFLKSIINKIYSGEIKVSPPEVTNVMNNCKTVEEKFSVLTFFQNLSNFFDICNELYNQNPMSIWKLYQPTKYNSVFNKAVTYYVKEKNDFATIVKNFIITLPPVSYQTICVLELFKKDHKFLKKVFVEILNHDLKTFLDLNANNMHFIKKPFEETLEYFINENKIIVTALIKVINNLEEPSSRVRILGMFTNHPKFLKEILMEICKDNPSLFLEFFAIDTHYGYHDKLIPILQQSLCDCINENINLTPVTVKNFMPTTEEGFDKKDFLLLFAKRPEFLKHVFIELFKDSMLHLTEFYDLDCRNNKEPTKAMQRAVKEAINDCIHKNIFTPIEIKNFFNQIDNNHKQSKLLSIFIENADFLKNIFIEICSDNPKRFLEFYKLSSYSDPEKLLKDIFIQALATCVNEKMPLLTPKTVIEFFNEIKDARNEKEFLSLFIKETKFLKSIFISICNDNPKRFLEFYKLSSYSDPEKVLKDIFTQALATCVNEKMPLLTPKTVIEFFNEIKDARNEKEFLSLFIKETKFLKTIFISICNDNPKRFLEFYKLSNYSDPEKLLKDIFIQALATCVNEKMPLLTSKAAIEFFNEIKDARNEIEFLSLFIKETKFLKNIFIGIFNDNPKRFLEFYKLSIYSDSEKLLRGIFTDVLNRYINEEKPLLILKTVIEFFNEIKDERNKNNFLGLFIENTDFLKNIFIEICKYNPKQFLKFYKLSDYLSLEKSLKDIFMKALPLCINEEVPLLTLDAVKEFFNEIEYGYDKKEFLLLFKHFPEFLKKVSISLCENNLNEFLVTYGLSRFVKIDTMHQDSMDEKTIDTQSYHKVVNSLCDSNIPLHHIENNVLYDPNKIKNNNTSYSLQAPITFFNSFEDTNKTTYSSDEEEKFLQSIRENNLFEKFTENPKPFIAIFIKFDFDLFEENLFKRYGNILTAIIQKPDDLIYLFDSVRFVAQKKTLVQLFEHYFSLLNVKKELKETLESIKYSINQSISQPLVKN